MTFELQGSLSLTTSSLCHFILNCTQKPSPTVPCQVGCQDRSFCRSQPDVGGKSVIIAALTCSEIMKSLLTKPVNKPEQDAINVPLGYLRECFPVVGR